MKTGFMVHKADGKIVFMPSKKGLYFSDVKNDTAHVMINTVDSIKNKYTVKEYANALKAHSIQDIIGRPATKDYIKYVEKPDPELSYHKTRHSKSWRHTRTKSRFTKRQNYAKDTRESNN